MKVGRKGGDDRQHKKPFLLLLLACRLPSRELGDVPLPIRRASTADFFLGTVQTKVITPTDKSVDADE